jgi:FtsH-binding integral membrane protein
MISAGIILLEVYNSLERLLPFLADVIFRLYAILVLFSIHKKYDAEEKEKMANIEIASAAPSDNLSNVEAQTVPKPQNVFDRYAEIGGYVFAGINFVAGVIAMPYFLYAVMSAYINENQLKDSLVLLAIATMTTILALILFVGINQRNSTFVLPMLIVNAILLIVVITSVILPTMLLDPGAPKVRTKRPELKFEDKLQHFSALMIVAWVFLLLCVWSLNDKFKGEENDKKLMAADKEAVANYGTADK